MQDLRPADDDSIPDDELVYLRIFASPDALKDAGNGEFRAMSGGVRGRDLNKPTSCDLASLCTPEETRDRGTAGNFHVVKVTARALRAMGLRIRRDPIDDPPNPAHAHIFGGRVNPDGEHEGDMTGGLTDGERGKLARATRLVVRARAG